jgi:hypothetical protein
LVSGAAASCHRVGAAAAGGMPAAGAAPPASPRAIAASTTCTIHRIAGRLLPLRSAAERPVSLLPVDTRAYVDRAVQIMTVPRT